MLNCLGEDNYGPIMKVHICYGHTIWHSFTNFIAVLLKLNVRDLNCPVTFTAFGQPLPPDALVCS